MTASSPATPGVDVLTAAGLYWWADPTAHAYRPSGYRDEDRLCASCGQRDDRHPNTGPTPPTYHERKAAAS